MRPKCMRRGCEAPRSDGKGRLRWSGCWARRVDDRWRLGCASRFKHDVAEQAATQGFDLRTIRGAERADQEAALQRLAPVTWIALQPFRDHDIDLALEQLVQARRLAQANGDLRLGLAELRQARPQPIKDETCMDPDMQ